MYENNIKQHYVEYVERYVNVIWKKKQLIEIIRKQLIPQKEKERKVNHLCNQLRKIKSDLLNVEHFRKCPNPRPWNDSIITRHGLLACKTCKGLWNRDENSSRNMYKIIKSYINGLDRPEYMSRKLFKGATSATI